MCIINRACKFLLMMRRVPGRPRGSPLLYFDTCYTNDAYIVGATLATLSGGEVISPGNHSQTLIPSINLPIYKRGVTHANATRKTPFATTIPSAHFHALYWNGRAPARHRHQKLVSSNTWRTAPTYPSLYIHRRYRKFPCFHSLAHPSAPVYQSPTAPSRHYSLAQT